MVVDIGKTEERLIVTVDQNILYSLVKFSSNKFLICLNNLDFTDD